MENYGGEQVKRIPVVVKVALVVSLLLNGWLIYAGVRAAQYDKVLTEELNSLGSASFFLAGERHLLDSKDGKIHIITIGQACLGREVKVKEYGDISIATLSPLLSEDFYGLRLFASHYNGFTLSKADGLAMEGRFNEAKKTYEALIKFDPDYLPSENAALQLKRLRLLEEGDDAMKRFFSDTAGWQTSESWHREDANKE